MGPRPEGDYSIERIEVDKGYSKDNCKWATRREQSINKRNSYNYIIEGELRNIAHVSNELGINSSTVRSRLNAGFSLEDSLNKPIRKPKTLEVRGEQLTIEEISRKYNQPLNSLKARIRYGWPIERILSEPVRDYKRVDSV